MDPIQAKIRAALEATTLGFGVRQNDIDTLCRLAAEQAVAGVCVPPVHVSYARERLLALAEGNDRPAVVTVAGFPFADAPPELIAEQVTRAVADGAEEVDVVCPLRLSGAGEVDAMTAYARQMVAAAGTVPVKMILETAALTEDERVTAAGAAAAGGARWVKTSTGFHPDGGASVEAVAQLRGAVPTEVGVKASGGIGDRETAAAMLEAGADRIGASSVEALLGANDDETETNQQGGYP